MNDTCRRPAEIGYGTISPTVTEVPVSNYAFVTTFEVTADPTNVFDLVVRPEPWLDHWEDVVEVERRTATAMDGTGGSVEGSVRAPWGYRIGGRVDVVAASRPDWVDMVVTGTIRGTGRWELEQTSRGTSARFELEVRPVARWLRILTPVARPAFEAGHARVVEHAVQAAATHLDAEVLRFNSTTNDR